MQCCYSLQNVLDFFHRKMIACNMSLWWWWCVHNNYWHFVCTGNPMWFCFIPVPDFGNLIFCTVLDGLDRFGIFPFAVALFHFNLALFNKAEAALCVAFCVKVIKYYPIINIISTLLHNLVFAFSDKFFGLMSLVLFCPQLCVLVEIFVFICF